MCPPKTKYCKLVIIRHVPIFAIFVSAPNDEFTYCRIWIPLTIWKRLFDNRFWKKVHVLSCMLYKSLLYLWFKHRKSDKDWNVICFKRHEYMLTRSERRYSNNNLFLIATDRFDKYCNYNKFLLGILYLPNVCSLFIIMSNYTSAEQGITSVN